MTVELDQVPFGIVKVKHAAVQHAGSIGVDDFYAELLVPLLLGLKIRERNTKGKMRKGSQLWVDLRRFIAGEPINPYFIEKRQVVIPCP